MVVLIKPSSSLCNMKCKYCFYNDESERREYKSYGLMNIQTARSIISKILNFCGEEGCTFAFQGGEPTLIGLDFYKEFVAIVNELNEKNKKVFYSIQTNGLLIDRDFSAFFHENGFLVGISIDGNESIHDSARIDRNGQPTQKKVLETTELFKLHNVDFNILCVVNSYNAKKPDRLYKFFVSNDFRYLQFIPCLPPIGDFDKSFALSPEKYAFFLKGIFDKWYVDIQKGNYISIRMFDNIINMLCGYPPEDCTMKGRCSINIVIEADGSVFPCDFYAIDQWLIGNINTDSIEEMFNKAIEKQFPKRTAQTSKCHKCKFFNLCRGGCPRESEPLGNGSYYCSAMTEFFEYSIDRFISVLKIVKNKQLSN